MQNRPWLSGAMLTGAVTVALVALALLAPIPLKASPQDRQITISARSFAYSPGTVRVQQGDRVTLHLESTDVVHGLYVDGYGVEAIAEPGRPAQVTFVADRSGAFRFHARTSRDAGQTLMAVAATAHQRDGPA